MTVSWFQLLKTVPQLRKIISTIGENKDWYKSDSILYQIGKVVATVLTGIGIITYSAISDEDIQTISVNLAVAIPTVLTLCDGLAAVWLRLRTNSAIKGTALAKEINNKLEVYPLSKSIGTEETIIETIKSEVDLNSVDKIILVKKEN